MKEKAPQGKLCNSDRSQRQSCRYYHEKTGRCTMESTQDTWQAQPAKEKAKA
jgi:hypothetical protein